MENFRPENQEELQNAAQGQESGHLSDEDAYREKLASLLHSTGEGKTIEILRNEVREQADSAIEEAIYNGEYVASGKYGIVLKVGPDSFPEDSSPILEEEGIPIARENDPETAIKILKIYRPGKGEREYELQKKAFDAVAGAEDAARIPKPIARRTQAIAREQNIKFLNSHGAELKDNADLIFMDYIPGKDVSTIMHDFILKEEGYEPEVIDAMPFEQKMGEVGKILNLPPVDEHGYTPEMQGEIALRNEIKLFSILKKRGFTLDPKIPKRIEATLKILHANGISHGDVHGRNIRQGDDGEVYLLDFGRSREKQGSEESPEDFAYVRRLQELTTTPEEDARRESQKMIGEMDKKISVLKKNARWLEKYEKTKNRLQGGNAMSLANAFIMAQTSDTEIENFLILLKTLLSDGDMEETTKAGIREFISSLFKAKMAPFVRNKILQTLNSGWLK